MKDIKNYKSPWPRSTLYEKLKYFVLVRLWAFFFADRKHFTIQDNKLVRVIY